MGPVVERWSALNQRGPEDLEGVGLRTLPRTELVGEDHRTLRIPMRGGYKL